MSSPRGMNAFDRFAEAASHFVSLAAAVADLLETETAGSDQGERERVRRDVAALRESIELERRVGS